MYFSFSYHSTFMFRDRRWWKWNLYGGLYLFTKQTIWGHPSLKDCTVGYTRLFDYHYLFQFAESKLCGKSTQL